MENIKNINLGVEIGGTNIKVAWADTYLQIGDIIKTVLDSSMKIKDFKTHSNPDLTIKEISQWLAAKNITSDKINRVCISMFGPLNLKKDSEDYGTVLNTPKPGWKGFNVVKSFSTNLQIPKDSIIIELDVNCAAYLEYKLGSHE
jgi:predicted NBD/HSP70 family sugar kinase